MLFSIYLSIHLILDWTVSVEVFKHQLFKFLKRKYKIIMHFYCRVCFLFILASLGILYPYNLGALSTSLVVIYTLTFTVAGYSTASFHSQFAETGWVILINFPCHILSLFIVHLSHLLMICKFFRKEVFF